MMKAAIFNSYGGPEVIEIAELPRPEIAADEALVKVHAAAVNPKDIFIRKGFFKQFSGNQFPLTMGFDYAGEVAEIGASIDQLGVGDAVFGMLDGWHGRTCAGYLAVKSDEIAAKPTSLFFEDAAALPLAALTSLQALRDEAGLQAGQRLCINGASGGVGTMAVQIAKIFGAQVTAVSRAQNHAFLHGLGADICIDYREVDIRTSDLQFDVFFDVFGNQPFDLVKARLNDKGTWISTVLQPHVYESVRATSLSEGKKAKLIVVKARRADMNLVSEWVEAGRLRPVVQQVFPLEEVREAHSQQQTKHTRGKLVIAIS